MPNQPFMKKTLPIALFFCFLFTYSQSFANKALYVSPSGSNNNPGTIDLPMKDIQKAIQAVVAGDTIYLRGGIYNLSTTLTASSSGNSGRYINLWAYAGETPILDFSGTPYLSSSHGIDLLGNYWYLKGLSIKNAGDNGVFINGSNNIVENCQISYNHDTGLQISDGGSFNYIHNCDAFDNYDPATAGQNADGIDVKLDAGPGNVIRGCRCYDNADDGYDCYQTANRVVFDSCWAFHNGYNLWGIEPFTGNGNGFKLGGNFVPGRHIVTNCVSFDNTVKGFDQNNNTGGVTLLNCTGFRNGTYDFSFPTQPDAGVDSLINNISYLGVGGVHLESNAVENHNSWDAGFSVDASSFLSLDTSYARIVRLADGSLPPTTFLRLDSNSALINAGVNVGLPFIGSAPDLGAFESGSETFQTQLLPLTATTNVLQVTLNWTVIFEFNNAGWEVQRANLVNGTTSSWKDVGFVSSQGNVATSRNYSFVDTVTHFGPYQYRLKQISVAGNVSYSDIALVNVVDLFPIVTNDNRLLLYPNPVHDLMTVQFYIPYNERVSLIVYNSAGEEVTKLYHNWYFYSGKTYDVLYDVSKLPAGEYFIRYQANDGAIRTGKFFKY